MGKLPNPPVEINMETILMDNQNVESIEEGLKKNLPQLFAGLTVKPEWEMIDSYILSAYFYLFINH